MPRLRGVGLLEPIIIAVIIAAPLLAAEVSEEARRRARGTEQFRILYWPADEEQAIIAQQAATTALPRLQYALDIQLERRILIEICHTQQEFNERVGEASPPWVMGRAFPNQDHVVVKALGPQRIGKLVAHELCHIVLQKKLDQTGAPAPRWLHEGLAKYATADLPMADQQVLSQAAAADKLLTIAQLEEAFAGPTEKVSLAYAQSYTLVCYLTELSAGEGVGRFLEELGRTGEVERALVRAYHKPAPQLEQEWLEQVRRAYMGRGKVAKYGVFIWVAPGAVFIAGASVKLYRARRIRRRLQEEERLRTLLEGAEDE